MRWFALLAVLLWLSMPALAQVAAPPNGAHVVAGPEGVLLEWPGSAGGRYLVQVYSEGTVVVEREVAGTQVTVPLQAGPAYQWQVSLQGSQGFQPIVSSREFQVVDENSLVLAGANGPAGNPGPNDPDQFDGKAGQDGPDLTVTLSQVGGYVSLSVTGGVMPNKLYFLSPGGGPFLIGAPGGKGGDGAAGAPAYVYPDGQAEYDGSPGGNGGNGGAGGDITVNTNGLPASQILIFNTRGGAGGAPGPGGGPGEQAGTPGRPGPDGQVIFR